MVIIIYRLFSVCGGGVLFFYPVLVCVQFGVVGPFIIQ